MRMPIWRVAEVRARNCSPPILGVKTPISSEKYLLPILGTLIQKSSDFVPLIRENISDALVQQL